MNSDLLVEYLEYKILISSYSDIEYELYLFIKRYGFPVSERYRDVLEQLKLELAEIEMEGWW